MANEENRKVFDSLLETYVSLDESAETIVRQLRKTPKPESRGRIIGELRNIEKRRLELLERMDNLLKST
jgi:hypothetical protein